MTRPVTVRRGRISGVTISVPLITQRNKYLVLSVPSGVVGQLVDHLRTLPAGQRGRYMRRWMGRNQSSMLEAYAESGVSGRRGRQRFSFTLVPVGTAGITPRRTRATATPRITSPGAAPRITSPGEVRTGQPTDRTPGLRITRRRKPSLPRTVKGGSGTHSKPYQVRPRKGRATRGTGSTQGIAPFIFSIGGLGKVYFEVDFTLSQLGARSRKRTRTELTSIFKAAMKRRAYDQGRRLDSGAVRTAMGKLGSALDRTISKLEKRGGRTFTKYINSH
jgi:hypothetical protein